MEWLDIGKLADAVLLEPGKERACCPVVLSFSIDAAKKSRKRRDVRSPALAIIDGTASELRSVDVVTGTTVSTTAGTLRCSALISTSYRSIPTHAPDPPPPRSPLVPP